MQNIQGKTILGLEPNVGAMICYVGNLVFSLGLIYSIAVVVTDNNNKLTRFHAFQSILCSALGMILGVFAVIGGAVAVIVDTQIGFPILTLGIGLIALVFGLYLLIKLILAAMKAYKGEIYKMPFIGGLAEKWA
jgi:uncharacterized membrane protein